MKVLGGFLAGAAIGSIAALLMAPDSGKATRKKIADQSKKVTDDMKRSLSKSLDSLKESYDKKVGLLSEKKKEVKKVLQDAIHN